MPAATAAERRELDRVGAFSDGVFAIAITLLVLNIEVPDVPGSELGSAIADLSDDFVAYGISIPIAYTISQSLAKWFWLMLLVLSVVDRRRARRRGRAP